MVIDPSIEACLRLASERAMHGVFAHLGIPKSFLDWDCDNGFMVRAARMFGCRPALGFTRDPTAKREARRYANLIVGHAWDVYGQFDLILTCKEVPEAVVEWLNDGGHLVVASAFPNGKGANIAVNGLHYSESFTRDLQTAWCKVGGPLPRYVQVYTK